jgi:hypothetical protein
MARIEGMMRRIHKVVGIIGVLAFLATGLFMRRYPGGLASLDGGIRMMFRSRHIYLLLASLLNLGLGTYSGPSATTWRRYGQILGSSPILAAPPLLLVAFFREPSRPELGGPFTTSAVIGLFAGTICHSLAGLQPPGPRGEGNR